MPIRPIHLTTAAWLLALIGPSAQAQTTVSDAWARGTVAQQKASGAFMRITSKAGGKLVGVESSAAGVVEIHEMAMQGGVMHMHAVPGIDLPAGQAVELKPGGYHVMLMDLKRPLKAGERIELTLLVQGLDGKREKVKVLAPIRALGAAPAMN